MKSENRLLNTAHSGWETGVRSMSVLSAVASFLLVTFCTVPGDPTREIINYSDKQLRYLVEELDLAIQKNPDSNRGPNVSPRSIRDGEIFIVPSRDWTSGFFPGMLWMAYELTGDDYWLQQARTRTGLIEREKSNDGTHDMGFKIFNSFGHGYRLTGDTTYRDIIIESANTLISRYDENIGAIRSWDHNRHRWDYPVIIDNMMNLEMLFWASEKTGNPVYSEIAKQHAWTTLNEHFRSDYSSYHVIDFDTTTGEVRKRNTHQGAGDETAWARGQAWGLYGFTMTYRYTGEPEFLELAGNIADFMLNHTDMPDDLVPLWDYDVQVKADTPEIPRDVSAAAIMASALYELSTIVADRSDYYRETADQVLTNIYENYRSDPPGANRGFLLESSTGHHPAGYEIDTPIIYADYYFLEALLRKQKLEN